MEIIVGRQDARMSCPVEPRTIMKLTFPSLGTSYPIGGVTALWEFANGMRRLGHAVNLVHYGFIHPGVKSLKEITWFRFARGIDHYFVNMLEEAAFPDADFIFSYNSKIPESKGQPLAFVQGYKILPKEWEINSYRLACPKICISRWLVDIGKSLGVPEHQLVYVPYGLRHEKYRLTSSIENRPLQVAMVHSNHPMKGTQFGLAALDKVRKRIPNLEVMLFGTEDSKIPLPAWITFLKSPDQGVLVEKIYNGSRVFVSPSILEGFGFPCIEAMACGCAVVTTRNGGSEDYAIHGETALVSEPEDVDAMARNLENILLDEPSRTALALRGRQYVQKFCWDKSAGALEKFLCKYAASPEYYRQSATI